MEFPGVEDVLILILKRLPVKSLLKFMCVSKSWYSLIKSSYFISSHQNHHHQIHHPENHRRLFFYLSKIHGIWHSGSTSPEWIHIPMPVDPSISSIAGSCNGLLLIRNVNDQKLCLWNPTIRKHINLEPIPIQMCDHPVVHRDLGFGFDSSTYDYKVVAINSGYALRNMTFPDNAQLYSMSSGVWKNVRLPDYASSGHRFISFSDACFMRGVVHWISIRGSIEMVPNKRGVRKLESVPSACSVLTFDMRKESFGKLRLPSRLRAYASFATLYLAVIDDSLALLVPRQTQPGHGPDQQLRQTPPDKQFSVWMMKEINGVQKSWMFLYNIQVPGIYVRDPHFFEGEVFIPTIWGPLVFFKDKSQSSSIMNVHYVHATYYMESLVLLDCGTPLIDHKREMFEEDNQSSKRQRLERIERFLSQRFGNRNSSSRTKINLHPS